MSDTQETVWHPVEGVDPANDTFPAEAEIGGTPVLIFRTATGYRASEPLCPHQKVPLKTGVLMNNDTMVRCSRHNFIFRLDSGAGVNCPGMKLITYDVRETDGGLEIALPGEAADQSQ